MKKMLALLLAVMMVLSLAACGDAQTDGEATTTSEEAVTTTENQGEADATTTTITAIVENSTTTKTTTTSKPYSTTVVPAPTTTKAATLNPKTSFKFGTYKAAFADSKKQVYNKVSLFFYEEFDTVECGYSTYFSKEYYKTWCEDMGMSFDDSYLNSGSVVVDGTTYYYVEGYGATVPESYELTDTVIKAADGEFSLVQNGKLKLNKTHSSFGPAGTVYTLAE